MIPRAEIRSALPYALRETNLPLERKQSGKVRDWYPLTEGRRLLITTDRLSAFDRILGFVPYKGQVLNELSAWWFERTETIIANHALSVPDPNALLAVEVDPIPVEVIVRGYITGVTSTALWHRYSLGEREIYGHRLPDGLNKNQALPSPLITPTTKGGAGEHDERLTCAEVVDRDLLDGDTWERIQRAALEIFQHGQEVAEKAGLILVDTKYEFGRDKDGELLLIDEVHTPDSSRYWIADTYPDRAQAGEEPDSLDKEFIRLEFVKKGYRGEGEPPIMDDELWLQVSGRYIRLFEKVTGLEFDPGTYPVEERLKKNLHAAGILP